MRAAALILIVAAALFSATNPNQLTPAEVSDGWILLYDGESAFGWSPEGGAQWATDPDGDLSAKAGDSGDMVLNTTFGDFQLACEMKARVGKGSGIVINGVAIPPPRPGDKWHAYSITLAGGKIVAGLDGKKIFEQAGGPGGNITIHYRKGDSVSYRAIKLRPTGLFSVFNGKDLGGWRTVTAKDAKTPARWTVQDGALHVEQGPGQLETESTYKDFVLQLDARANSSKPRLHPNSGVFLRGEPGAFWSGYESQIRNEFEDEDRGKPIDFGTGGIYNFQPARRIVANDNEFFTKTIVVRGRHFAVWVNGVPVTEWDDPSEKPRLNAGTISLQAHDPTTNLDFRNIRIAELK